MRNQAQLGFSCNPDLLAAAGLSITGASAYVDLAYDWANPHMPRLSWVVDGQYGAVDLYPPSGETLLSWLARFDTALLGTDHVTSVRVQARDEEVATMTIERHFTTDNLAALLGLVRAAEKIPVEGTPFPRGGLIGSAPGGTLPAIVHADMHYTPHQIAEMGEAIATLKRLVNRKEMP